MLVPHCCMPTAPPGQTLTHAPQPVQKASTIVYPAAPGYAPPTIGTTASFGHTRRAGQAGERSHIAASIAIFIAECSLFPNLRTESIYPMGYCSASREGRNIPSWQDALVEWRQRTANPSEVCVRKIELDGAERRMLGVMLLFGVALGSAFPLLALLFVKPKDDLSLVLFWAVCSLSGTLIGYGCYLLGTRVARGMLRSVLTSVAGSLRVNIGETDTVASMSRELERVAKNITGILEKLHGLSARVRALSAEVMAATEQQASGSAEQAAAVTQMSATLEELAQTSKQIADNSESVVRVAERTMASVEDGLTAVSDTESGIEEIRVTTQQASDKILALGERSQEIGRVLIIIDEIAEQTKILALNAAIEAARAGEAGKGFAVVAEEIRKLADSVTESTQEIGRVVREIQSSTSGLIMSTERAAKKVDEGKQMAQSTADALDKIVHQMEETTDSAKQISIATQQQRTASDQVVVSMREVAQVSQQTAEAARQVSKAVAELSQLSDEMAGA